jgi:O-antigen/teichoic acid export membrane protein
MIKKAIQFINGRELLRHNLVFFIGTLVIAVFNYLYYPVIGHMVSVSSFGEIQAVIALFMQLGILLTAFGYVVTNIINNANNDTSQRIIIKLEQMTLIASVLLFTILCVSSVLLKTSLQFTSITPLILVGFLVVLNVPSTSRTYFLQGRRALKEVSVAGVIFAIGKLLVSVILILAGFDILAVMLGYIIAQTANLVYLLWKTRGTFPSIQQSFNFKPTFHDEDRKMIKDEVIYGIAILVLLSGITVLYSSDSIVMRLFFSPFETGMYSGISAVARIVFFVTASVAGVLLAMIKMEKSYNTNLKILLKSFGMITLIGGGMALLFILFPTFSISVLFGTKYAGIASLLPIVAILMLVCSYNNLLVCYEIALRRFKAIYIVGGSIILLAILVAFFHHTITEVVLSYLAANLIVFMLLSIQIIKRKNYV